MYRRCVCSSAEVVVLFDAVGLVLNVHPPRAHVRFPSPHANRANRSLYTQTIACPQQVRHAPISGWVRSSRVAFGGPPTTEKLTPSLLPPSPMAWLSLSSDAEVAGSHTVARAISACARCRSRKSKVCNLHISRLSREGRRRTDVPLPFGPRRRHPLRTVTRQRQAVADPSLLLYSVMESCRHVCVPMTWLDGWMVPPEGCRTAQAEASRGRSSARRES